MTGGLNVQTEAVTSEGFNAAIDRAANIVKVSEDTVADTEKQKKVNKGLTKEQVDAIRAKGGTIVYNLRHNAAGDKLIDLKGTQYDRDLKTGVMRRTEPKVNGKKAKAIRRGLRLLEEDAANHED